MLLKLKYKTAATARHSVTVQCK